ncbi:Transcriptional Coactivator p15 (PC4) [Caballeronia catudaia]|uniref:Transcriptional Coactivator p15 (PC4) n=1 Tax=Caballeronia catudaia TaxID=1777136 RepID=A0A158AUP6_9BURK|nr:transcriptional coactivator p15/PC4 family protein [Caballeronia catudaia]SAK61449.1 Transcriptional Coactivator p15 (PC4) [Caballeronia catudaia]
MPTTESKAATPLLDLRRSDSERLRVTVSEYRGRSYIDLRIWFATDGGELKPSRAGVSLRPEQVGEVVQALLLGARSIDPREGN